MAEGKRTEQKAGGDAWYVDESINVTVPTEMQQDDLLRALGENRTNLESLKRDYYAAISRKAEGRTIFMYFHEIMRVVNAIEVIKNRLVLTGGGKVPFSDFDIEHPDHACERFRREGSSCYVVTAVFGARSRESFQVRRRCRGIFLLNPLMTLGWCLYQYYGPLIARWSLRSKAVHILSRRFLAEPIVQATCHHRVRSAFSILYLLGMSLVGLVLLIPCALIRFVFRLLQ